MSKEIEAYRKHKNLKIAARELGMAWQALYVILRKAGEPVTGDKLRYGSDRDKLGALAEAEFKRLVPFAQDLNDFSLRCPGSKSRCKGGPAKAAKQKI